MLEQIVQIRMLLANVNANMQSMIQERELYLKKYDSLLKENEELEKKIEELEKKD